MSDSLIREEVANYISEEVSVVFEVISVANSDVQIEICRHVTVVFEEIVAEQLLHKNEVRVIGRAAVSKLSWYALMEL